MQTTLKHLPCFSTKSILGSGLCSLLFLAAFTTPTYAEIYRCTNAQGKVISADRIPAECKGLLIKVYSNSGSFKSQIDPPLSAEEKQKREKVAEEQKRLEAELEALQREERFLTAHFRSEADILNAKAKAVELIEGKRKLVLDQLNLSTAIVADLSLEITRVKQTDKGGRSSLQRYEGRLEEIKRSIKNSQDQLAIYDSEIERINREYEQTLHRYRVVVVNRRR